MTKDNSKTFFRHRLSLTSVAFVAIMLAMCFQYLPVSRAADSAFTQSDWSGGVTANTATHTDDQTGWDEFNYKDDEVSATATEATLGQQAINKMFSTDTDFSAGTNDDTNISGTGNAAAIELEGQARQVVGGDSHTCALKNDGSVFCWGYNIDGQLGDNTTSQKSSPIQVLGVGAVGTLSDVVQIAAGASHTCALKNDGSVFCWGLDDDGQLGDDSTDSKLTPVQVLGVDATGVLSDIIQIAAGSSHTCALKNDGSVFCWGNNWAGELGDNTTTKRYTPVQVLGVDAVGTLTDVGQVASGGAFSCALKNDGSVFCWGYNGAGELGDGSYVDKLTPVQVLGVDGVGTLTDVSQITTGWDHACALKTDGSVNCWGYNPYGQLGDNTTTNKNVPVQVLDADGTGFLTGVNGIAAGMDYVCALKTDGSVFCWGYNNYGQLGDDTTVQKLIPVQVLGVGAVGTFSNANQITAGSNHTAPSKTTARFSVGDIIIMANWAMTRLCKNLLRTKSLVSEPLVFYQM